MPHAIAPLADGDRLRILVVEDMADARLLLKLRLQQAGYTVIEAESGEQALAFVAQGGQPHLVLLDLLLPDLDGFAVAMELRRLTPAPIIVLSAQVNTQTKVEALTH